MLSGHDLHTTARAQVFSVQPCRNMSTQERGSNLRAGTATPLGTTRHHQGRGASIEHMSHGKGTDNGPRAEAKPAAKAAQSRMDSAEKESMILRKMEDTVTKPRKTKVLDRSRPSL